MLACMAKACGFNTEFKEKLGKGNLLPLFIKYPLSLDPMQG
jgi:hypothetical protein